MSLSLPKLGAVVVKLPSAGPHLIISNTASSGAIPGRSGGVASGTVFDQHTRALHHPSPVHNTHIPVHPHFVPPGDSGFIPGRSTVVPGVAHPAAQAHTLAAHHPTHPVHNPTIATHPHFVPPGDSGFIPGRSTVVQGVTHPAAHAHPLVENRNVSGHVAPTSSIPAVQDQSRVIGTLRAEIHSISGALQKSHISQGQMLEVFGIGTDVYTLGVLIGLLQTQGYHATIASCDGSVRPGFHSSTAVIRGQGGPVGNQFLQEVGEALRLALSSAGTGASFQRR